MLKVFEYRSQLKALKDEGTALLLKAEGEKRELNADEKTRFDAINTEMNAIEGRMDNYIKVNRIPAEQLRAYEAHKSELVADRQAGPFKSFGEQLMAVRDYYTGQGRDNRLFEVRAASGLNESNPTEGGFLVQTDFVRTLLAQTYETNEIPNRCRRIPISSPSNNFSMNIIDETSRATGSRWGGIRVYRENESDPTTASKPKFGKLEMKLEKMMGVCYATDELMADAAALGEVVSQGFREEFGFKLSDEIIRGTGAGQCLGILNSGSLVTVPKETAQAADTVVTENILKMWKSRQGRNLVWLYNQELEDQLDSLTLSIGTGGVEMRLFTPPAPGQKYGSIKGAPAIPIEVASGAGDAGDIILADLQQYLLIDKGGIQTAESIHVQFLFDETTFRFIYRVNGQPMRKNKITPYKRTSSDYYVSPFVTLAAR
jgi:HK97 family phage major capsid protein